MSSESDVPGDDSRQPQARLTASSPVRSIISESEITSADDRDSDHSRVSARAPSGIKFTQSRQARSRNRMAASKERRVKLKLRYKGEIRVVAVSQTTQWSELVQRLTQDYGFGVSLRYEDEDGDQIVLASQNDLNELMQHHESGSVVVHVKEGVDVARVLQSPTPSASGAPTVPPLEEAAVPPPATADPKPPASFVSRPMRTERHMYLAPLATVETSGPIRWQRGHVIGQGAFGTVYLGLNLDSGELMAVKQLDTGGLTAKETAAMENEVLTMRGLSHENIVRYLGTERTETTLSIFMEYVPGGSIKQFVERFGQLDESVVRVYTRQLLLGLEVLHRMGIAHRDIKGANVLVANDGTIKLADFGASKRVSHASLTGTGVKGTPHWMAPEVIKQEDQAISWRKADIWSVACTVLEMLTGKPPWSQFANPVTAMYHIACHDSLPDIPTGISEQARDFLTKCLVRDPALRPEVTSLLLHPFVTALPPCHVRHLGGGMFPMRPATSAGPRRNFLGRDTSRSAFNSGEDLPQSTFAIEVGSGPVLHSSAASPSPGAVSPRATGAPTFDRWQNADVLNSVASLVSLASVSDLRRGSDASVGSIRNLAPADLHRSIVVPQPIPVPAPAIIPPSRDSENRPSRIPRLAPSRNGTSSAAATAPRSATSTGIAAGRRPRNTPGLSVEATDNVDTDTVRSPARRMSTDDDAPYEFSITARAAPQRADAKSPLTPPSLPVSPTARAQPQAPLNVEQSAPTPVNDTLPNENAQPPAVLPPPDKLPVTKRLIGDKSGIKTTRELESRNGDSPARKAAAMASRPPTRGRARGGSASSRGGRTRVDRLDKAGHAPASGAAEKTAPSGAGSVPGGASPPDPAAGATSAEAEEEEKAAAAVTSPTLRAQSAPGLEQGPEVSPYRLLSDLTPADTSAGDISHTDDIEDLTHDGEQDSQVLHFANERDPLYPPRGRIVGLTLPRPLDALPQPIMYVDEEEYEVLEEPGHEENPALARTIDTDIGHDAEYGADAVSVATAPASALPIGTNGADVPPPKFVRALLERGTPSTCMAMDDMTAPVIGTWDRTLGDSTDLDGYGAAAMVAAVGAGDGIVHVWDVVEGKLVARLEHLPAGSSSTDLGGSMDGSGPAPGPAAGEPSVSVAAGPAGAVPSSSATAAPSKTALTAVNATGTSTTTISALPAATRSISAASALPDTTRRTRTGSTLSSRNGTRRGTPASPARVPSASASRDARRPVAVSVSVTAITVVQHTSFVVTGTDDGTVWVWDILSGSAIRELSGHTGSVRCLEVQRADNNASTGRSASRTKTRNAAGQSKALMGLIAASGSQDQTVRIWDLSQRRACMCILRGHTGPVNSLAWIPNTWNVASASADQTVRMWDTRTGRRLGVCKDHFGAVLCVVAVPCIVDVAADGDDTMGQISGSETVQAAMPMNNNSYQLVSGARDGSIKVWNLTGSCERSLRGHRGSVTVLRLPPDPAAGSAQFMSWLGLSSGMQLGTSGPQAGELVRPDTAATTTTIATQLSVDTHNPRDSMTGVIGNRLSLAREESVGTEGAASAASGPLNNLYLGQILSAGSDGLIKLWDYTTTKQLKSFEGHRGPVTCVEWPVLPIMCSGGADGSVRVWHVPTGACMFNLCGVNDTAPVCGLAWRSDWMTVTFKDGSVKVWRWASS